jgi:hypothetical protein
MSAMRRAHFRRAEQKRRGSNCQCRVRSNFFFLDDGSAYNLDTAGTVWYQAANSLKWVAIHRCKDYIAWANGIGRLDHVIRVENGFAALLSSNWHWKRSTKVPVGRPTSGGFVGFQTGKNSCIVFHQGRLVYDGLYASDCDGVLGFHNEDHCTFYSFGESSYRNWLTEENCNNNNPPGNDTTLYRNTAGDWNTATWEHTENTKFMRGNPTHIFSSIAASVTAEGVTCTDDFGWTPSYLPQDCCAPGLPYDTGMHLGTNESGSLVWFTIRDRKYWWNYAGQVDTVDDLPDVSEQDNYDVIVVGEGDYWDCEVYYLLGGEWKKYGGTYHQMVMNFHTACVIHEDTKGITTENCVKKSDVWKGNAARIQACGDVALVNGNVKGLARMLLFEGKLMTSEKAIDPRNTITLKDTIDCALSQFYRTSATLKPCQAKDGIVFARMTLADGGTKHMFAYIDETDWNITWSETTPPGESVWRTRLNRGMQGGQNCWWVVIGRTQENGTRERKIFYKGQLKATYVYRSDFYLGTSAKIDELIELGKLWAEYYGIAWDDYWEEWWDFVWFDSRWYGFEIGWFSQACGFVYRCPKQSASETFARYSVWDESGNQIVYCSDMYDWCSPGWAVSERDPVNPGHPKTYYSETVTYSYNTIHPWNGTTTTITLTERIEYHKVFFPNSGKTRYRLKAFDPCYFVDGVQQYYESGVGGAGCFTWSGEGWNEPWGWSVFHNYQHVPCTNVGGHAFGVGALQWSYDRIGGSYPRECKVGFLDEPPQVVEWVKKIDNDLPYYNNPMLSGWYESPGIGMLNHLTEFSYEISFCGGLVASPTGDPTELNFTTKHIFETAVGSGKNYDGTISTTTYSIPIWNCNHCSGRTWKGKYSPKQKRYAAHALLERETGQILNQIFMSGNRVGFFQKDWTLGSDGRWHAIAAFLVVEMVEKINLGQMFVTPNNPNPMRLQQRVMLPVKYTTHVFALEADSYTGIAVNVQIVDNVIETLEYEPHVERSSIDAFMKQQYGVYWIGEGWDPMYSYVTIFDGQNNIVGYNIFFDKVMLLGTYYPGEQWFEGGKDHYYMSSSPQNETCENIQKTLYYKLCIGNDSVWSNCGYTFETVEGRTRISWNGNVVYTSPPPETGIGGGVNCCREAFMLSVTETLYQSGTTNPASTQIKVFIEGKQVHDGEVVPTDTEPKDQESIAVFRCCSTHDKTYRYAMLGINDLIEELVWGENLTLTDGTVATKRDDGLYETPDGIVIDMSNMLSKPGEGNDFTLNQDAVSILKKNITDKRKRTLYCNGSSIGSNKRYDGMFCCGEFVLCTYVDDDYLSGWSNSFEYYNASDTGLTQTSVRERKWTPNPCWGDKLPPPASDRAAWERYKNLYPGFSVDVFHAGKYVGTFGVSDGNSPVHYDHVLGEFWKLLYNPGGYSSLGGSPGMLEGAPQCRDNKVLIPFDGGITTCLRTGDDVAKERRVFV